MNVAALRERLIREGFRQDVYSLDGSPPAYEGLILTNEGGRWRIEHCERGMRRELAVLEGEEEACERMYELLNAHFRW
jgi:hypothetical protein